jgi:hypothetical protein
LMKYMVKGGYDSILRGKWSPLESVGQTNSEAYFYKVANTFGVYGVETPPPPVSIVNVAGFYGNAMTQEAKINLYKNYAFPFELSWSLGLVHTNQQAAANDFILGHRQASASYFNALMTYRNGPYGWPMWKQVRTGENKIIRKQRKHNIMTIVTEPGNEFTFKAAGKVQTVRSRYGVTREFNETPVTSKYKPMVIHAGRQILMEDDSTQLQRFTLKATYGNNTSYFNNSELNKLLALKKDTSEEYEHVKDMYLDGGLDSESPIDSVELVRYSETIFPPLKYTGKKFTRKRVKFDHPWKDKKEFRIWENRGSLTNGSRWVGFGGGPQARTNPGGREMGYFFNISRWPLDTYSAFENEVLDNPGDLSSDGLFLYHYGTSNAASTAPGRNPRHSGSGVLNAKQFASTTAYDMARHVRRTGGKASTSHLFLGVNPFYAWPHTIQRSSSVVSPTGMRIDGINTGSSLGNIPKRYLPRSDVFWDAGRQSGKSPFPNSYGDFSEGIRQKAKDYSIVPEFRISNHVKELTISGSSRAIPGQFELTGALTMAQSSSNDTFYKIYSNSDFLKHFDVVREDHEKFIEPVAISLRCKAMKKFLPYQGFYPVERTVELAKEFFNSTFEHCKIKTDDAGTMTGSWITARRKDNNGEFPADFLTGGQLHLPAAYQNLLTPMFAPGILYNSIKAGIACEFPTVSSSIFVSGALAMEEADKDQKGFTSLGGLTGSFNIGTGSHKLNSKKIFDYKIPFEALVEPESNLVGRSFGSLFAHPQLNNSSSVQWNGSPIQHYKMMAHNFLAETADFFLQDGQFTTISSLPSNNKNVGLADVNKVYAMRIKMYKSSEQGPRPIVSDNYNYTPPQYATGSYETFTMYSRPSAFGPPVVHHDGNGLSSSNPQIGENWTHTPTYYNGESWCDVYFSPTQTRKYSIQEIIASSSYYNTKFHDNQHYQAKTLALSEGLHGANFLPAAVNIDSIGEVKKIDLLDDSTSDKVQIAVDISDEDKGSWIIQSKYETPHLNFSHLFGTTVNENNNPATQLTSSTRMTFPKSNAGGAPTHQAYARGMWHQYGRIEKDPSKGIFMQVVDVPDDWLISNGPNVGVSSEKANDVSVSRTGSLADLVGFDKTPRRMGEIASAKIIREAVVAVPFVEDDGNRKFFALPRKDIKNAISSDKSKQKLVGRSVRAMVDKMKRFVFPPSMDFVHNVDIDPFAMYIFEFKHKLTKQDLGDIWQNLYPDATMKFEEATSTISHRLLAHELLGGGAEYETGTDKEVLDVNQKGTELPPRIQWMVFKAKQRAKNNYYEKIVGKPNFTAAIHGQQIEEGLGAPITYNWPYDFFSLVELVKIEAEIGLGEFREVKKPPVKAKVRKKPKRKKPKIVKRPVRANIRPGRGFGRGNITPGNTED